MPGATIRAAGLVVGGALLAACGGANPYSLPEYDPSAQAGAAGTQRPEPTRHSGPNRIVRVATPSPQVKYTPADALGEGAWVERGRIVAGSAAARAAVRAMTKYVGVRVQLSNTWRVDERALAATASGQAVTSARERAQRQRDRARRSIGRFVVNVSSVRVDGDRATVTGCHFDATSEVDEDGYVLVAPPGGVLITMHLHRTRDTWRVLDWPDHAVPACDGRA